MLGTGIGQNGSRLGLSLPGFCTPGPFSSLCFFPGNPKSSSCQERKKVYREFTGWSLSDLNPYPCSLGSKAVTGMEPGWQRPSNAQQGGQAQ